MDGKERKGDQGLNRGKGGEGVGVKGEGGRGVGRA